MSQFVIPNLSKEKKNLIAVRYPVNMQTFTETGLGELDFHCLLIQCKETKWKKKHCMKHDHWLTTFMVSSKFLQYFKACRICLITLLADFLLLTLTICQSQIWELYFVVYHTLAPRLIHFSCSHVQDTPTRSRTHRDAPSQPELFPLAHFSLS